MSISTLSEGTIFNGRYRIVRCIAQGGMGAVYEAVHIETERHRALKVMLPHLVQSDEMRTRFRQEAKVAAHIESEFIVDVFDAGIDDETQMPFLVMELLRGEELGMRLRRGGPLSPNEVLTYLHQTALALDKTHRAHIVHRDLKPDNLFLTEREDGQPRIKVLDFGIAKFVSDSGTNAGATRSLGTPLYMAPEQFKPGHYVSPATDIYALGMIAYTLLVGVSYWYEESQGQSNIFAFAAMAVNGPPEPATPRAARRGITLPPSFDAWFARTTAPNPSDRPATAGQAILELADALGLARPGLSSSGSLPQEALSVAQTGGGNPTGSGVQTGGGIHTGSGVHTGSGTANTNTGSSRRGAGIAVGMGVVATLVGLGAVGLFVVSRNSGAAPAEATAAQAPAPAIESASAPTLPAPPTTAAPTESAGPEKTIAPPAETASASASASAAPPKAAPVAKPSAPAPKPSKPQKQIYIRD